MTRPLGLGLFILAVALPVAALGGNPTPALYLEVYGFEEEPSPVPFYICGHPLPEPAGWEFPCFHVRMPYFTYYIPIHVNRLNNACPFEPGPACVDYGGFVGVPFGIVQSAPEGTPLTFQSWNACPGFLKGVSVAGEPAACAAYSTSGCMDGRSHPGYLAYVNASNNMTRKVLLFIFANADLGHNKVINCAFTYDEGTIVGGGAEIDDVRTIICGEVPVEENTWGSIKALFR